MSVLRDILEWSAERPIWQRDAIRRIATQENLSQEDLAELTHLCLAGQGIVEPDTDAIQPIPFSEAHIPQSEGDINRVNIIGLREIIGVNNLAPDQQLNFQVDGMTIIFGYNGSGKSGYARILRSLCHARHRGEQILPNVFSDGCYIAPSATVEFQMGGENLTVSWQQGQEPLAELGRVSFFDADCAAVQVDDENEVAFTPFGLDILPKLVNVCRNVGESIREIIYQLDSQQPNSLINPQVAEGTKIRQMLSELDHNSNIDDIRRMAEVGEEKEKRISDLQELLSVNPAERAQEIRSKIKRLEKLQQNLQITAIKFSIDNIENIRFKLEDVITKKAAASAAAEEAFSGQPLAGVGEEVWRELWEAARRYSQQYAYPELEYPFTEDDARCVLCQQPLTEEARARFVSFENFIKADTQQAAEKAESELSSALSEIEQLTVGLEAYKDYLSDLPDDQIDLNRSIRRFHKVAWKIKRTVLKSCDELQWSNPLNLTENPTANLESFLLSLRRRATELERVSSGQDRQTLVAELNELIACQWLKSVLEDIESEIERKKKIEILKKALAETNTTGITRLSSDLTDRYVTTQLQEKMIQEIRALGAEYIPVALDSAGGQLGQKKYKIVLRGAAGNVAVRQILSEGEFRCIAIAGFLTELSTEQTGSALIFDDPVSSLDHLWRRKVADRLVQVAQERQVIVFTHDIVFLSDIVRFCGEKNIPLKQSYLFRGADRAGECIDGVPWAAMKVNDRIKRLNGWLQEAETKFSREGREAYEPEARRIYGHLRETWERAVEEVLLNGVVIRFDHAIHTQQLRTIADITDDDIQAITNGMTKSSRFLEGHDEAKAVMDSVPAPDELRDDIANLESWVREVRRRR